MALTKEDLQAIQAMFGPINTRLDSLEDGQQAIKNSQLIVEQRLDRVDKRLDAVEETNEAIRSSQLNVELVQYPRISGALDGAVSAIKKNDEQDKRIVKLENNAENHEIRIWALEKNVKEA